MSPSLVVVYCNHTMTQTLSPGQVQNKGTVKFKRTSISFPRMPKTTPIVRYDRTGQIRKNVAAMIGSTTSATDTRLNQFRQSLEIDVAGGVVAGSLSAVAVDSEDFTPLSVTAALAETVADTELPSSWRVFLGSSSIVSIKRSGCYRRIVYSTEWFSIKYCQWRQSAIVVPLASLTSSTKGIFASSLTVPPARLEVAISVCYRGAGLTSSSAKRFFDAYFLHIRPPSVRLDHINFPTYFPFCFTALALLHWTKG